MSTLRQLLRDERGSMLPVLAGVVLLTMAGAALAVDLTRASALRADLQTTADSAALAAAARLPDVAAARKAALAYATKNMGAHGDVLRPEDVEFGQWDPEGRTVEATDEVPSAVRVTTRLAASNGNAVPTFFAGTLGTDTIDLGASATAGRRAPACVVALSPTKRESLKLDSNASLDAQQCTVQVSSTDAMALQTKSNSTITAASICVAGGADVGGGTSVTPDPTTNCPPPPDPLAALEPPAYGACNYTNASYTDQTISLGPGVYCKGLQILGNSNITLNPGTYVIKDGPFTLDSNAAITGDGVTIYLTGPKAVISLLSNASVNLIAPTAGPLAGILFFQDRDFGGLHLWESNEPVDLRGTVYLPNGNLRAESSNSMTPMNSCNVLIANSIHFQGNSGASIDLSNAACRSFLPSAVLGTVALLE